MKKFLYKSSLVILAALLMGGCAGSFERVRPQAIQPGDADLSNLKDNLVFLSVHVSQQRPMLKLRGMLVKNRNTDELYSLPFFDNVLLKSKELQHSVNGNTVEHLVFLDLPAATYELVKLEFFNIARFGKVQSLDHEVRRPVLFEVSESQVLYLGRLDVEIVSHTVLSSQSNIYGELHKMEMEAEQRRRAREIAAGKTSSVLTPVPFGDSFRKAAFDTLQAEIQELGGVVRIRASGHHDIDLKRVKARYQALAAQPIHEGRLWLQQSAESSER